jgi:hypothetical protein
MNCDECGELLNPYMDAELSDDEKVRVEAHLAQCEDCRRLLHAFQQVNNLTQSAIIPLPEDIYWESLTARSMRGVQRHFDSVQNPVVTSLTDWYRAHQRYLVPLAVAAAVVLAVFIGGRFLRTGDSAVATIQTQLARIAEEEAAEVLTKGRTPIPPPTIEPSNHRGVLKENDTQDADTPPRAMTAAKALAEIRTMQADDLALSGARSVSELDDERDIAGESVAPSISAVPSIDASAHGRGADSSIRQRAVLSAVVVDTVLTDLSEMEALQRQRVASYKAGPSLDSAYVALVDILHRRARYTSMAEDAQRGLDFYGEHRRIIVRVVGRAEYTRRVVALGLLLNPEGVAPPE